MEVVGSFQSVAEQQLLDPQPGSSTFIPSGDEETIGRDEDVAPLDFL